MKIGFIGAGNMATAIIKGYLPQSQDTILAYDIDEEKMQKIVDLGVIATKSIEELVIEADYLFLAVKPQQFDTILPQIKAGMISNPNIVLVSIAAGISSNYLKEQLQVDAKIVRVMPNTPLLLGYGATALSKILPTAEDEFQFVCHIFEVSGTIAIISEDCMNEVISVSGSTPAYIYEITKYFIQYATEHGIKEQVALALFSQTLIGAANMMTQSGNSLDQLIEMVSSKGGTTIAGLQSFRSNHLEKIVWEACEACTKRAYELTK